MPCTWANFHLIDCMQYDVQGSYTENMVTGRYWALKANVDESKLPQVGESPSTTDLPGTWYVDHCQAVPQSPLTYEVTV